MVSNNLGSIFKALDIKEENGLAFDKSQNMTTYQKQFFLHAKEKLNIDAVYFLRDSDGTPKIPLIYFSAMDSYDPEKIAQLHRLSWNMGNAPLLFVVLPDKILIYNNYVPPKSKDGKLDPKKGLIETIEIVANLEKQRKLQNYHRIELETGEYWRKNNKRFNVNNRIDTTLINNLRIMRKSLLKRINSNKLKAPKEEINSTSIVHGLLGRSILIKYLEERTDSQGNSVFPSDFFSTYLPNANSYTDILKNKEATYKLFSFLEDKFHGDIFPLVDNEIDVVSEADLQQLRLFLIGDIDLESNQLTLWPLYSFNAIPIQLISSIYELFFHLEIMETEDEENGTYYTPYHLVELLMDEVLPWEGPYKETKVLDPACGSGIFLVEAYRRIIGKWMYTNEKITIDSQKLIDLMRENIFGIDCNGEAIRIASFSLCLTMCDYLEPRSIWRDLEFPELKHNNLFISDFFSDASDFVNHKFDIIIGNPPWESTLSPAANEYIIETKHPIGDDQIAQAFSWRAAEFCHDNGDVCLLMPSKGFLFNRSNTNSNYRRTFLETYDVSVIINFSAFRKVLFDHATGPAVGIVFKPQEPKDSTPIFYCTPKPIYSIEDRRKFFIEPIDICRIPRDIIDDDRIWKIAMWGGPRDLDLINKITVYPSLRSFADQNKMSYAEGFKKGNRKKTCTDFLDQPVVYAKNMLPYYVEKQTLSTIDEVKFECTVERNRSIFYAPHLLIKQSPKKWRFWASALDYDAVFNHSILGINGNNDILKYLCLIINSKLFSYYHIMTSRRWLVERDELEAGEILSFPIPALNEDKLIDVSRLFNKAISSKEQNQADIDQFVFNLYKLTDYEVHLVEDAINFVFDYFNAKGKSHAFSLPKHSDLKTYSEIVCKVLQASLDRSSSFDCKIYSGHAPLAVAQINLLGDDNFQEISLSVDGELNTLLKELDALLLEERSESVYVKRNVRVYSKNVVYVIKPNQQRYWTYSAACRDADEIFADIMRAWRGENE